MPKQQQVVRVCHYCGGPAGTKDHVVPRVRLNRTARYMGQIVNNTVPACETCNQRKGSLRVHDCCDFCRTRWELYGPLDWRSKVPTISLADLTLAARAEATG